MAPIFLEVFNNIFLLKLAKQMGVEHLEVGVSLGLTSNTIRQIEHDYRCTIDINNQILRTWRDNVDYRKSVSDMFNELVEAFQDIERMDLQDFVRNGELLFVT